MVPSYYIHFACVYLSVFLSVLLSVIRSFVRPFSFYRLQFACISCIFPCYTMYVMSDNNNICVWVQKLSLRCPWFGLVWFGFGFCSFQPIDSFYRIRANHNFQSFVLALFCVGSSDVVAVVVPSSSSSFEFAHPPLAFAHWLEITVLISLHTAISVHYLVHSNGTNFVCFVCAAWELKFVVWETKWRFSV